MAEELGNNLNHATGNRVGVYTVSGELRLSAVKQHITLAMRTRIPISYKSFIVEEGKPEDVIWNPKHTYTSIRVKSARP